MFVKLLSLPFMVSNRALTVLVAVAGLSNIDADAPLDISESSQISKYEIMVTLRVKEDQVLHNEP